MANVSPNAYTDAPPLHPNLIWGGVQALFWLFFHPSAWRNHLARIDPSIPVLFNLADLSPAHLRKPALLRLLLPTLLLALLFSALLTGLPLLILGVPLPYTLAYTMLGVAAGSGAAVIAALWLNVVPGLTTCALSSIIVVALGLITGQETFVPTSVAWLGLSVGFVGGLAAANQSTIAREHVPSLTRQAGGILVGLLFGIIGVAMMGFAAFVLSDMVVIGIAAGVLIGLAVMVTARLSHGSWRRSLGSGLSAGLTMAVILSTMFGIADGRIEFDEMGAVRVGLTIVAIGALTSVASGLWRNWRIDLIAGLAIGIVAALVSTRLFAVASLVPETLVKVLLFGAFFLILLALPYVLTMRLAGQWGGAMAAVLSSGGGWITSLLLIHNAPVWPSLALGLLAVLGGFALAGSRFLLLYPLTAVWNTFLYQADLRRAPDRPSLLRYHSAFWDEHQRVPLLGLDTHLVLVAERHPEEGQAAIQYLAVTWQRWAARAAEIELVARRLDRCADVNSIGLAYRQLASGELPGPASVFLGHFILISQDVEVALQQSSAYYRRLSLRGVSDRLSNLLGSLTRSNGRYAARFYPVAAHWSEVISRYELTLAQEVESRQEIANPYIFGVPLSDRHAIFIGRTDIAARIEQLLLDMRRPPLLLYGQRRMGKTSLLRNLGHLLPSTIIPLFVDGEGIAGAGDYPALLHSLGREMSRSAEQQRGLSLPPLRREELVADPFTCFNEWLDQVEDLLQAQENSIGLLALDEFEALDSVLSRGRFSEADFLGMLRHIIQHRPHFKVLLAGSHLFDEFQRWAAYLINVQVVKVGYLGEEEALRLIESPVRDFPLRYEVGAGRRVLELTRGHPHLLQLLCYEIVELKNEQPSNSRRLVTLADVESAVPRALDSGRLFFVDIQANQTTPSGLTLLKVLSQRGEGAVAGKASLPWPGDDFDETVARLLRRDLIEPAGEGYRFQVEMVRRWFAQQG